MRIRPLAATGCARSYLSAGDGLISRSPGSGRPRGPTLPRPQRAHRSSGAASLAGAPRRTGRRAPRPRGARGPLCVPRGPPVRRPGARRTDHRPGPGRAAPAPSLRSRSCSRATGASSQTQAHPARRARLAGRSTTPPPVARTVGSIGRAPPPRRSRVRASASRKAGSPTAASSEPASDHSLGECLVEVDEGPALLPCQLSAEGGLPRGAGRVGRARARSRARRAPAPWLSAPSNEARRSESSASAP